MFCAYVCNPLPWPFSSNWTAVKILEFNPCATGVGETQPALNVSVFPNPFHQQASIQTHFEMQQATLDVFNPGGQKLMTMQDLNGRQIEINRQPFSSGLYFFIIKNGEKTARGMFVVK